jgi:MoaA/NifB/PqqE/SkfB family radical SAM enzyme
MLSQCIEVIELLKQLQERKRPIVVWGTGRGGGMAVKFCEALEVPVDFFVDIKIDRKNNAGDTCACEHFMGKNVCATTLLKDHEQNRPYVLIATMHFEEVQETLENWGFINVFDYFDILNFNNINVLQYDKTSRKYIAEHFSRNLPLFSAVEIETLNRCNGLCSFCPVNAKVDTRKPAKMSEELFDSIIQQLSGLKYSGILGLYSNNEPFLDKRILRFMKKTHEMLPDTFKYIYTNATLMTFNDFLTAIEYLDLMIIDNYTDGHTFLPIVKEIYDYCLITPEVADKVKIYLRKQDQALTTRGGQAPNRKPILLKNVTCILPFQQLIIRPDGGISLCCNDALGKYTLGNATEDSLLSIWNGEKYSEVRRDILRGRDALKLCNGCDTLSAAIEDSISGIRNRELLSYM